MWRFLESFFVDYLISKYIFLITSKFFWYVGVLNGLLLNSNNNYEVLGGENALRVY